MSPVGTPNWFLPAPFLALWARRPSSPRASSFARASLTFMAYLSGDKDVATSVDHSESGLWPLVRGNSGRAPSRCAKAPLRRDGATDVPSEVMTALDSSG